MGSEEATPTDSAAAAPADLAEAAIQEDSAVIPAAALHAAAVPDADKVNWIEADFRIRLNLVLSITMIIGNL